MSLTQLELDEFVTDRAKQQRIEAMYQAEVRRYELVASAAGHRGGSFEAANGIMSTLSPVLDGMLMALGGAVLVLAIFG